MQNLSLSADSVAGLITEIADRFQDADLYFGHGTDNAEDEAAWLVFSTLNIGYDSSADVYARRVSPGEKAQIESLCQERVGDRRPLAYLLNEAWFMGLPFFVDERVLVPRSPIAELIDERFQPWIGADESVNSALDVGTGSGCIAVALATAFPEASIDAVDISGDALDVARVNIDRHGVEDRIRLIESDLFGSLDGNRYDLIVANPPYVDAEDMRQRPVEFQHEPELGLASGADGLDATRVILKEASRFLTERGILVCEVGNSRAALEKAFPTVPFTWLDFERGGDGVFLLHKHDLES